MQIENVKQFEKNTLKCQVQLPYDGNIQYIGTGKTQYNGNIK